MSAVLGAAESDQVDCLGFRSWQVGMTNDWQDSQGDLILKKLLAYRAFFLEKAGTKPHAMWFGDGFGKGIC